MRQYLRKPVKIAFVLALLFAGFCGRDNIISFLAQPPGPHYLPEVPAQGLELAPESEGQWMRKHTANKDSVRVETQVFFRNGDTAVYLYRDNRTLKEHRETFADGRCRMHILYAADGVTAIKGHRIRSDNTRIWEISQLDDGTVNTTTFWRDGRTVFAETTQKPREQSLQTSFFRSDGTLWIIRFERCRGAIRKEIVHDHNGRPVFERLWDEEYTLAPRPDNSAAPTDSTGRFRVTAHESLPFNNSEPDVLGGPFRIAYLSPDGHRLFRQRWNMVVDPNIRRSASDAVPIALVSVDEYSADGSTVTRTLQLRSTRPRNVIRVLEPGPGDTRTVKWLEDDGITVSVVVTYVENGREDKRLDYPDNQGPREHFEPRLFTRAPPVIDPVAAWKSREAE